VRVVHVINDLSTFSTHRRPLIDELKKSHEIVVLAPDHLDLQTLIKLGYDVRGFPLSRKGLNPLAELKTLLALRKKYLELRPDLVHHFTIKPVIYGTMVARWAKVPRIVNTITGLGYVFTGAGILPKLLRPLVGALYQMALKSPHVKVIFQNRDDLQLFAEQGLISPSQAELIPGSGIDTQKFSPSPEPESPPIRVLLPARMLWDKGVAEFVSAAKSLRQKRSDIVFELAGALDPQNRMAISQTQLGAWQDEGAIKWLGKVDDMPHLLSRSHIVCLPSYREGMPMALLEAAACGKPIVTTDVPGCRELVHHEQDGLLVPARDSEALAQAILRLADAPALRRDLGSAARSKAVRDLSCERVNQKVLNIYSK
jgi:glycosyltransferase involved in cell wall biosynthesis